MDSLISVENKELTKTLTPLDTTLTKNIGGPLLSHYLLPTNRDSRRGKHQKPVLLAARRHTEDPVPGPIQRVDRLLRLFNPNVRPAVMKFHQQMFHRDAAREHVPQDVVFRAFDVHFQQVNL